MFIDSWKFVMASALFVSIPLFAADSKDQLAYCSYLMEQAQAHLSACQT